MFNTFPKYVLPSIARQLNHQYFINIKKGKAIASSIEAN